MDDTSESSDRLSELPDPILLLILSFLPIKYAVWTTLLSKRWKDLWTSVPCLNFIDVVDTNDSLAIFHYLVVHSLQRRKGSKILKLKVDLRFNPSFSYDFDLFLHVAVAYEVEELSIIVYTCPSIFMMKFLGYNLETLENMQWKRLKCLTFDGVCLNEDMIKLVVSFAPRLEVLSLRFIGSNKDLIIESTSLKTIKIEKFVMYTRYFFTEGNDDGEMDDGLRIWAPNLETLEISGISFSKIYLIDVSLLRNAVFCFSGRTYLRSGRFSGYELSKEMLSNVFQYLQCVENVTLSDWCVKVIGEMMKNSMFAPLFNAKFLKLYTNEVDEIMDILDLFPKLNMLVLELNDLWDHESYQYMTKLFDDDVKSNISNLDMKKQFMVPTIFPKLHLLDHLRTVVITWIGNDSSIYLFIEFVLKYASSLEKMVVRLTGIASLSTPDTLIVASQKLEGMTRASSTVKVILCGDDVYQ